MHLYASRRERQGDATASYGEFECRPATCQLGESVSNEVGV
jgi:hypothetical protein